MLLVSPSFWRLTNHCEFAIDVQADIFHHSLLSISRQLVVYSASRDAAISLSDLSVSWRRQWTSSKTLAEALHPLNTLTQTFRAELFISILLLSLWCFCSDLMEGDRISESRPNQTRTLLFVFMFLCSKQAHLEYAVTDPSCSWPDVSLWVKNVERWASVMNNLRNIPRPARAAASSTFN